jgi:hypothetical protein
MWRERNTRCTDDSFPAIEARSDDLNAIAKIIAGMFAEARSRCLDEKVAGRGKSTADHDALGRENLHERSQTKTYEISRHIDCADR